MSFYAYFALASIEPRETRALVEAIEQFGLKTRSAPLAKDHGVRALYGLDVPVEQVFEVELDPRCQDIEQRLLEPVDPEARWRHYQACAAALGRTVEDFRDDEDVDQRYRETPIDLAVVDLLRLVAEKVRARPVVMNLDPDFDMRFGRGVVLAGLDAIRAGVWAHNAFGDLQVPLRLVLPEEASG